MAKNKMITWDGAKATTIFNDEGWVYSSGETGTDYTTAFFASRLPIIYRALNLRANGVSSIPFDIVDKSGHVVDSTDDWQNYVGFWPDPEPMFWQFAAARTLTGCAYAYKSANTSGAVKVFRPLAPASVVWDKGAQRFKRSVGGTQRAYLPAVTEDGVINKGGESIVYLYMADPDVEWGAPHKYPAISAVKAMGVLYNMDEQITAFFKRGMIHVTAFSVPAGTPEAEKQRFEDKINNLITGIRNAFRTIFLNAQNVNPIDLGGGLDGLSDIPLTKEKREDVALALGVPITKLFSDSASGIGGGGVSQTDDVRLILDTCLPEFKAIARDLNEQVLTPLGLHIEERHERMDMFQESEDSRIATLNGLVDAFTKDPDLAQILCLQVGITLDEEVVRMLDERKAKEEAKPEPVAPPEPVPPVSPMPVTAPPESPTSPTSEIEEESAKFMRKALKNVGKAIKFESDVLEPGYIASICEELPNCKTADEVRAVFANHAAHDTPDMTDENLAAEMKRAMDWLEAHD